jgi:hypothetical protein
MWQNQLTNWIKEENFETVDPEDITSGRGQRQLVRGKNGFLRWVSLGMILVGVAGQDPGKVSEQSGNGSYIWNKPRSDGTCDWSAVIPTGSLQVNSLSNSGGTKRSVGWNSFEVTTLGLGSTSCVNVNQILGAQNRLHLRVNITEVENQRSFELRKEYETYDWIGASKTTRICPNGDGSAGGATTPSHDLCKEGNCNLKDRFDATVGGTMSDAFLEYNGVSRCDNSGTQGWGGKPVCFFAGAKTCNIEPI